MITSGCILPPAKKGLLSPMTRLKAENPALFTAPEFWPVSNAEIDERLGRARQGERVRLGTSAGGRDLWAVCFGEFEPQSSTATVSSAMASDRPQAFYDPSKRTRPVLAVIGSIHGGETEGIALCMNLFHLMEHGTDLTGRRHSGLRAMLEKVRLVLVPCLNPDGREAAGVMHLNGALLEELFFVQQGTCADGSLFRGRKVKETQPIPKGFLSHMGGYYNADGVNLQHDDFFGPRLAPENRAIMDLFQKEVPDAFLTLHAHGGPAAFITPDAFLSPGYQRKQIEAAWYVLSRLVGSGVEVTPPEKITTPPWSFYFQTWLHHMTGAMPLLFEFCHGLKQRPYPLEKTLETGFLLMEAWIDYCLRFDGRPLQQDLFGPIAPAR